MNGRKRKRNDEIPLCAHLAIRKKKRMYQQPILVLTTPYSVFAIDEDYTKNRIYDTSNPKLPFLSDEASIPNVSAVSCQKNTWALQADNHRLACWPNNGEPTDDKSFRLKSPAHDLRLLVLQGKNQERETIAYGTCQNASLFVGKVDNKLELMEFSSSSKTREKKLYAGTVAYSSKQKVFIIQLHVQPQRGLMLERHIFRRGTYDQGHRQSIVEVPVPGINEASILGCTASSSDCGGQTLVLYSKQSGEQAYATLDLEIGQWATLPTPIDAPVDHMSLMANGLAVSLRGQQLDVWDYRRGMIVASEKAVEGTYLATNEDHICLLHSVNDRVVSKITKIETSQTSLADSLRAKNPPQMLVPGELKRKHSHTKNRKESSSESLKKKIKDDILKGSETECTTSWAHIPLASAEVAMATLLDPKEANLHKSAGVCLTLAVRSRKSSAQLIGDSLEYILARMDSPFRFILDLLQYCDNVSEVQMVQMAKFTLERTRSNDIHVVLCDSKTDGRWAPKLNGKTSESQIILGGVGLVLDAIVRYSHVNMSLFSAAVKRLLSHEQVNILVNVLLNSKGFSTNGKAIKFLSSLVDSMGREIDQVQERVTEFVKETEAICGLNGIANAPISKSKSVAPYQVERLVF